MASLVECKKELIELSNKIGYLTFDNIIELSDEHQLSIIEVDELSSDLQLLGIIVYEEEPEKSAKQEERVDYAQSDYEIVYQEIISLSNDSKWLVERIRELPVPQYGEIGILTKQMKQGNAYARERMILLHLRLALKIALSETKKYELQINDAISSAIIGLTKAVDKYEDDGFRTFQSYCIMWMRQSILRHCSPVWMNFYFPVHIKNDLLFINRLIEKFDEGQIDYELINNILNNCDLSEKRIRTIIKYLEQQKEKIISLEELFNDETDDYFPIKGITEDSFEEELYGSIEQEELSKMMDKALNTLTPRERFVLEERFGFNSNGEGKTLEEIARYFGLTRERIRQIEVKALRKMRHPSRSKKLKVFL